MSNIKIHHKFTNYGTWNHIIKILDLKLFTN